MKITADTNILVRAIMADDAVQSPLAAAMLANAEFVVVPIHARREVAWVLSQSYKIKAAEVFVSFDARAVKRLAAQGVKALVPAEAG